MIGRPILASIVEDAIAAVPGNLLGNWDAVDDFFGGEDQRIAAADTMDEKLITENPGISDKLSKYVRLHRFSYVDLLDEIDNSITQWRATTEEYER